MAYAEDNTQEDVQPWDAAVLLSELFARPADGSKDFLACQPAKWFPGMVSEWQSFLHGFGIEARSVRIETAQDMPQDAGIAFAGSVDGERIFVHVGAQTARALVETFTPRAVASIGDVVVEYLARKFFSSLSTSWAGPPTSGISFQGLAAVKDISGAGVVRIVASLNNASIAVTVALGHGLVQRLARLWQKQQQSTGKGGDQSQEVYIEIAQLAVPPSFLGEYLRSSTLLDLEVPVSDRVMIKQAGRALCQAQLGQTDGRFAFEVLSAEARQPHAPEGTTRISISLGSTLIEAERANDLKVPGSVFGTPIPLGQSVSLSINGESVGQGDLCVFNDKFALRVR